MPGSETDQCPECQRSQTFRGAAHGGSTAHNYTGQCKHNNANNSTGSTQKLIKEFLYVKEGNIVKQEVFS